MGMIFEKVLVLCILVVVSHLGSADHLHLRWRLFKSIFNKTYTLEEDNFRRQIWQDNLWAVETHNKMADEGKYSFWLKMNDFADLTTAEVHEMLYGWDITVNVSNRLTYQTLRNDLPTHVDWRAKGFVTPVKYQGHCGACYAFSTTGALEGQHARKYGKLVSLSEQNIVDCTQSYGNKGCHGGNMDKSFQYVIDNGGIDTESSYPYVGQVQSCHFKKSLVGSGCSSYEDIPRGDEMRLQDAVAKEGPVSVGVDAKNIYFRFYSHGVFDYDGCSSKTLNHGMLVVGYGTRGDQDYWLVKNSWGRRWGKDGYIEMSRNKNNQCGIASMASYPVL